MTTPEGFINEFVDELLREAARLRGYAANEQATTCEKIAGDLSGRFRAWWLESLTIAEAAQASGYAEESPRQMAREGRLPHARIGGEIGHLLVRRCDLPTRARPKVQKDGITALADRLLPLGRGGLRKPA